jgi:formylglycine-generating enzyme required for sulfatase activity
MPPVEKCHQFSARSNKSRLVIVRIPAGTFRMGTDQVIRADDHWKSCSNCPARNDVERPVHRATISEDFWMGQFPVTQRQWQEVTGNNPSDFHGAGPEAPVEQVSWKDVQAFLAKLNTIQVRWTVRLPTEAEWEYAARAGSTGESRSIDRVSDLKDRKVPVEAIPDGWSATPSKITPQMDLGE